MAPRWNRKEYWRARNASRDFAESAAFFAVGAASQKSTLRTRRSRDPEPGDFRWSHWTPTCAGTAALLGSRGANGSHWIPACAGTTELLHADSEIGRASCRERGWITVE